MGKTSKAIKVMEANKKRLAAGVRISPISMFVIFTIVSLIT